MTANKIQRGRPKGSGINDELKLREIARRLHADPLLKPTTAIKAIGVTDPSTIRRLRDKFHLVQSNPVLVSNTTSPRSVRADANTAVRAAPLKNSESTLKADVSPEKSFAPLGAAAALGPTQRDHGAAAALLGFGLTAATALFEQQIVIVQSVFRLPSVRDFLRQQIEFTEFMLSVAAPSPGSRLTH